MGFLRDLSDSLGFTKADATAYETSPEAYKELYDSALSQLQGIGDDSKQERQQLIDILGGQLGSLENNAEGRKKNFLEDSARSFSADTQNLARAKGGTGGLAGALRNSGQMYDAQARSTSRGLNDLYSQATQDLSTLSGVQNNLYDQDAQKRSAIANTYQGELASRRGQLNTNADNKWNVKSNQGQLLGSTLGAAAKLAGASGGGK